MKNPEQELADRARAELVCAMVGWSLSLRPEVIAGRGKGREASARRIAIYVTRSAFGMSLTRVARAFGRDRSTIASACQALEDRRDDPRFDRWIEALERAVILAPAPIASAEASS